MRFPESKSEIEFPGVIDVGRMQTGRSQLFQLHFPLFLPVSTRLEWLAQPAIVVAIAAVD